MGQVTASISISLDGFVAGPDASLQDPLGKGGEQLHDWVLRLAGWRRRHGYEGGETGVDDDVMEEANRDTGAVVMGRGMFSGGAGLAWEDDPNPTGWWGDEPPFHVPVFVVTSHPREPLAMEGGTTFTFVTEGVERAVELARGGRRPGRPGGGRRQRDRAGAADGASGRAAAARRARAAGRRGAPLRRARRRERPARARPDARVGGRQPPAVSGAALDGDLELAKDVVQRRLQVGGGAALANDQRAREPVLARRERLLADARQDDCPRGPRRGTRPASGR